MPQKRRPHSGDEAAAEPPPEAGPLSGDARSTAAAADLHVVEVEGVLARVLQAYEETRNALQALSVIYAAPAGLISAPGLIAGYLNDPSISQAIDAMKLGQALDAIKQEHHLLYTFKSDERFRHAILAQVTAGQASNAGELPINHDIARVASTIGVPLRRLSAFQNRIESAAVLMSCAFAEASVNDFKTAPRKSNLRSADASGAWYAQLVNTCLDRFRDVRSAMVHSWTPTPQAEVLADEAFLILADMTSAKDRLVEIHRVDRVRARSELVQLLDPIADEVAVTARLLADGGKDVEPVAKPPPIETAQAAILAKAGGIWSLSQAAEALDITRQGLHKKITKGAVLGVMHGRVLAVPRCQFERIGIKSRPVNGLGRVIALFRDAEAGDWSALQFLVELDPNLVDAPIAALHAGKAKAVEAAARAYLSLDEG